MIDLRDSTDPGIGAQRWCWRAWTRSHARTASARPAARPSDRPGPCLWSVRVEGDDGGVGPERVEAVRAAQRTAYVTVVPGSWATSHIVGF